jgi:hypothetical protein
MDFGNGLFHSSVGLFGFTTTSARQTARRDHNSEKASGETVRLWFDGPRRDPGIEPDPAPDPLRQFDGPVGTNFNAPNGAP